jgi:hypothetical protein
MMAREAAWMIDEEASYTCRTRRNCYVTNDMLDGLSTSYKQTSEWRQEGTGQVTEWMLVTGLV